MYKTLLRARRSRQRSEVLQNIWDVGLDPTGPRAASYINHCRSLLNHSNLNSEGLNLTRLLHATDLVQRVKGQANLATRTLQSVENDLGSKIPAAQWMESCDVETKRRALQLALSLWLFVHPDLENQALSLQDVCRSAVPQKLTSTLQSSRVVNFTAKSLLRRGGFHLQWTGDLSEHLTFPTKKQLMVFGHASILQRYQKGIER